MAKIKTQQKGKIIRSRNQEGLYRDNKKPAKVQKTDAR
jgi:hypothetical protein